MNRVALGILLSGGLHVLAYVQMSHARAAVEKESPAPVVIEVETAPPLPPPAPPAPEPTVDAPAVAPVKTFAKTASPAQAVMAQAGKTITAADDAPGAADFTMVQGGGTYAGGVTSSVGTSKRSVAEKAPVGAVAAAENAAPTAIDRSKPAQPIGGDWDCKSLFPASAHVDTATVIIVARVSEDGAAAAITVVSDPGQGFGAAARACALRQKYAPAEDHEGRRVTGNTTPFRVRFTR